MTTPKLQMPELVVGQAGKELTHNQALAVLDQLAQAVVVDKDLTAPPGSPANGSMYIVAASATGDWSGQDGKLAYWITTVAAWTFITPADGWSVWVTDEAVRYERKAGVWVVVATGGGGGSLPVVQTFTGPKTLALADINTYNVSQDATAQAVTLPAQATVVWTADAEIHFQQGAAGAVNITAAAGVSINGVTAGTFTLAGIYSAASLKRTGSDAWTLIGAPATTGASGDWCNATGTANAIVLTPASAAVRAAYAVGDQFRARIGTANTGATTVNVSGLGVKTCLTVTGAALPAGYIRTDADTVMTYDGTNFVVDRLAEYGSNANGEFWRYADGKLDCMISELTTDAVSNAHGSIFRSNTLTWTLPAAYIDRAFGGEPRFVGVGPWSGSAGSAISGISMRAYAAASVGTATFNWSATGRWY